MRVFISSTFKDLRPERQAAREVLERAELTPWGMELFVSEPSTPLDVALRELALSDAVVLIIGFRAGSLVPERNGLTYTSAEFKEAKELGKPIFTLIQTEEGSWRNKETMEALRVALDDFKKAVLASGKTPAYFESPDQLQREILLAVSRWKAAGCPGARKTFATAGEFFAPYAPKPGINRLFDFEQTLMGRGPELSALEAFLNDSQRIVGILPGRGGIGKSKLLRDWVARITDRSVVFVQDGAIWHNETKTEIPHGSVLIVADDAHHFESLESFLALVCYLREDQDIKVLLTTRPSGSSQIDTAVAGRFDPIEVERFSPLQQLTLDDVRALARQILGSEYAQHAEALATLSADTPLVTVVGGRLIARGEIEPALLANEDEFRRAVFDRFTAEHERLLPEGPIPWRALLNLIAAISPIRPRMQEFLEPAQRFLGRRADEVLSAIDTLERHGLLLRGGNLVRIVPDVLSDHLLEGACVNLAGEPTGYAEAVFEKFSTSFSSNLLRNLAELDWRITHRHPESALLEAVWVKLRDAFEAGDAFARKTILDSLEDAAIFQPARVLTLVQRAMETEAQSANYYGIRDWTQEDVREVLPPLLKAIAYHPEFTEEAIRRLWQLSKLDNRRPNQYPEHPVRVLEDLASYERYKSPTLNDRIAHIVGDLVHEADAFTMPFTPFELVDKLLEKEAQAGESRGFSFSLWSQPLNYPVVRPIRQKAMGHLETGLFSVDQKVAVRAVRSFADILSGFFPTFGRQATQAEHEWQDGERIQALQILKARVQHDPLPPLLARQIGAMLRQLRPRDRGNALGTAFGDVLAAIPATDELTIFDAFFTGPWDRDIEFASLEQADESHADLVRRGVELFRAHYGETAAQITALEGMLNEAHASGTDLNGAGDRFIQELCEEDDFLREFAAYCVAEPDKLLGSFVAIPLRILRFKSSREYQRIGIAAAGHEQVGVAIGAANAICFGPNLNTPADEDAAIIERLSAHSHRYVRHASFTGVGRLGKEARYLNRAVGMLLGTEIGSDPDLADDMCGALAYGHIDPKALSEEQVRALLQRIVPTRDIDQHHIGLLLDFVGRTYSGALVDFILQRLDRNQSLRSDPAERVEYDPLPHGFSANFHGLQSTPQYQSSLEQVRDRLVTQGEQRYLLESLFWLIGTLDNTTLAVLDEWLHSNDKNKAKVVIRLVSKAPSGLAVARPYFAVHLAEECAKLDGELFQDAIARLVGNAQTGITQRTSGEPSAKLISMRDRAAELRDVSLSGSAAHSLWSAFHDSSARELERDRIHDDEFLFGGPKTS